MNTAKFTRTVRRPTSLCDQGLSPPISECDKTSPPSESQFPRPSALLWPEAVGFRPTKAFHCSVAEELHYADRELAPSASAREESLRSQELWFLQRYLDPLSASVGTHPNPRAERLASDRTQSRIAARLVAVEQGRPTDDRLIVSDSLYSRTADRPAIAVSATRTTDRRLKPKGRRVGLAAPSGTAADDSSGRRTDYGSGDGNLFG